MLRWLETEANVRIQGTLKQRPVDRFEREREQLKMLAPGAYCAVVLRPEDAVAEAGQANRAVRVIDVQCRPLAEYARIAGGAT